MLSSTTTTALTVGVAVAMAGRRRRRRRRCLRDDTVDGRKVPRLSVICCARNEEANIARALASIRRRSGDRCADEWRGSDEEEGDGDALMRLAEVIVVDGCSDDATVRIARRHGAKVLHASPCRSEQLNVGAAAATGDVLLFLHADVELPTGYMRELHRAAARVQVGDGETSECWGAFKDVRIDAALEDTATATAPRPLSSTSLAIVETGIALRTELLSLPYGDQGLWMTRRVFDAVGGFPALPFMEDYEMVRRLKSSYGRPSLIRRRRRRGRDMRIVVSGRRWRKLGVWKTFLVNQAIIALHNCGVSPDRLRRIYYCF